MGVHNLPLLPGSPRPVLPHPRRRRSNPAPPPAATDGRAPRRGNSGGGRGLRRLGRFVGLLGRRRLGALTRPWLVELDPPLAVLALLQRQLRAERAARAAAEARHRLGGLARGDQLAGHGHRELLARLALPDHEAAAWVLARPARVALAVLVDVAPADRARA